MLYLGLPVMDGHELTQGCVAQLRTTMKLPYSVGILIIDNASEKPYTVEEFVTAPFNLNLSVCRLEKNQGYYRPISILASMATSADLVALMHNDVLVYEEGWDQRLFEEFLRKPDLGMVGFFGSDEVDDRGGRGGGSMGNFRGTFGIGSPAEAHGKRVHDLRPALVLDSLFMATRVPCVSLLKVDAHTPICHFMDKVWPLRLVEAGWKVGVLGIDIDHMGGQTATGSRFDEEAKQWCIDESLTSVAGESATALEPGGLMLYLEAERRFLTEMRAKHLVPSRMQGWNVVRG